MGRKTLYNDEMPYLAQMWARYGLTDEQIWHNLGIGKDSFYSFIKLYPEFSDAIKEGRKPVNYEVENSLLKKANGYEVTEEVIEYEPDENGKPQIKSKRIITKHIAPDTGAAVFWLTNRDKDRWKQTRHLDVTTKDKELPGVEIHVTPEEIKRFNKELEDEV